MKVETPIAVRNVLFPTDFSEESVQAVGYLRRIQHQFQAYVHVLHVLDLLPPSLNSDLTAVAKAERARQWGLLKTQGIIQAANLDEDRCKSAVIVGDVALGVEQFTREHNIDLIVLGSRADTGITRLFEGSVAEEIFREARCPVLVIGPQAASPANGNGFRHLLFATDLGQTAKSAVPYVEYFLSQDQQAGVSLAHFLEHEPRSPYERHKARSEASRALEKLIDPGFQSRIKEIAVEFCSPQEGMIDIARKLDADLLILGVRQAGAFTRAQTHGLRSITHRIISESPCPVLTVRSPGAPSH